jgi:DNA (cytosine-5)-methyltransferase 1
LASMGFDAKWGVLGANDIGANHQRDRIWIRAELAHTERMGRQERPSERGELAKQEASDQSDYCGQTSGAGETASDTKRSGLERRQDFGKQEVTWTWSGSAPIGHADWWSTEPNVGRVAHGVAARMEQIKAIGNGQVPLCAATAWRILK